MTGQRVGYIRVSSLDQGCVWSRPELAGSTRYRVLVSRT